LLLSDSALSTLVVVEMPSMALLWRVVTSGDMIADFRETGALREIRECRVGVGLSEKPFTAWIANHIVTIITRREFIRALILSLSIFQLNQ
jgi:hypothetical protein